MIPSRVRDESEQTAAAVHLLSVLAAAAAWQCALTSLVASFRFRQAFLLLCDGIKIFHVLTRGAETGAAERCACALD